MGTEWRNGLFPDVKDGLFHHLGVSYRFLKNTTKVQCLTCGVRTFLPENHSISHMRDGNQWRMFPNLEKSSSP